MKRINSKLKKALIDQWLTTAETSRYLWLATARHIVWILERYNSQRALSVLLSEYRKSKKSACSSYYKLAARDLRRAIKES